MSRRSPDADQELARLARALEEAPRDPGTWAALATRVRRSAHVPDFLVPGRHLDALLEVWAGAPEERALAELLPALLGVRPLAKERREPGAWWEAQDRLGESGDHWFDRVTGMPLFVEEEVAGIELAWVPPGEFLMGSPEDEPTGFSDERPAHTVRLERGFWIGVHPVTRDQFIGLMGYDPSLVGEGDHPVNGIARAVALRFSQALSMRHGLTGESAPDFDFRLPSEAEWEYACRAGTRGPAYGPDRDALAWTLENAGDSTHAVGGKLPNAWGLYDMLGNVWEWCLDVYRKGYEHVAGDGAPFTTDEPDRSYVGFEYVHRGGCWGSEAFNARAARRGASGGRFRRAGNSQYFGLRVVLATRAFAVAERDRVRQELDAEEVVALMEAVGADPGGHTWDLDEMRRFAGALEFLAERAEPRCLRPLLEFLAAGGLERARGEVFGYPEAGAGTAYYSDQSFDISNLTVYTALTAFDRELMIEQLLDMSDVAHSSLPAFILWGRTWADRRLLPVYRGLLLDGDPQHRYATFQLLSSIREPEDLELFRQFRDRLEPENPQEAYLARRVEALIRELE